jgi:hypothetical protein
MTDEAETVYSKPIMEIRNEYGHLRLQHTEGTCHYLLEFAPAGSGTVFLKSLTFGHTPERTA